MKKNIKIALILIGILIVGIIVYKENKEIYSIEDRVKNIQKETQKDSQYEKTIGWIKIQGTVIDYPVIYYRDGYENEIKKQYAWTDNTQKRIYNHVTIYGHNIVNLSANPRINGKNFDHFEDIMAFVYPEFIEKNKYIQYSVDDKNYVYKVFGVRLLKEFDQDSLNFKSNRTEKEIEKYLKEVKKDNIYKANVDVQNYDAILSLVTCTRMYGAKHKASLVIDARMVRPGERLKDYTVVKTDNYKKIKKLMKGDEKNA